MKMKLIQRISEQQFFWRGKVNRLGIKQHLFNLV